MDNWALLGTSRNPENSHVVLVIETKQSNGKPQRDPFGPIIADHEAVVIGWEKCPPEVKKGWFKVGDNEYSSTRPEKPCNSGMMGF